MRPFEKKGSPIFLPVSKAPGSDKFQSELIEMMPLEQIQVLQKWLNEVLARGELVTKMKEKEIAGKLVLLHKSPRWAKG